MRKGTDLIIDPSASMAIYNDSRIDQPQKSGCPYSVFDDYTRISRIPIGSTVYNEIAL
jgi:hypothetical protein